jgi:putative transcriptional regulator
VNIDKIAAAIETDAGIDLPDLRASLAEMQADIVGRLSTPEQLLVRAARHHLNLS